MGVKGVCIRGVLCLLGLWSALAWAQPGERTHLVQRKETAYGIARQYGVALEDLYRLNPGTENGIRRGAVLRIPPAMATEDGSTFSSSTDTLGTPVKIQDAPSMSLDTLEDSGGRPQARPVPPVWPMDTIRVAVFLPFHTGRDSLSPQPRRLREIALDCAAGIRWALDEERPLGAHVEVRFLDTGRNGSGSMKCTASMLDEGEFDVDLAIGPLRQSAWEAVRTWPRMKDAVHLVLTDLGPDIVQGKPRVLFPYSQSGVQMALLAERVAEAHVGEQVMLLTTGDRRNAEAEEAFQDGWDQADVHNTTSLIEVEISPRGLGDLKQHLSEVRRNVMVVPGGVASRSFAGVLQTTMQLERLDMDFVLYADGSWRDFDFLDPDIMNQAGLTVCDGGGTPVDSVAGESPSASLEAAQLRRLSMFRGGQVGEYGVLAHDLTRNALLWTAAHGPTWPERLAAGERLISPGQEEGIWTEFRWEAWDGPGSGLVNTHARVLHLQALKWVENGRPAPSVLEETDQGGDE